MKKTLIVLLIAFCGIHALHAAGIKLYIGSAEFEKEQATRFFLQLIICNNLSDTIYIQRDDIDNIYPRVNTDASIIGDGGSYYLLNNITNLVTDQDRILKMVGAHPREKYEETTQMQRKLYGENNKLPQKEIGDKKYYIIAPNKCLTVNSVTQSALFEFAKLADITPEQEKLAEVYLTLPVSYRTSRDETPRAELLIARSSEELKKCIFLNNKKK